MGLISFGTQQERDIRARRGHLAPEIIAKEGDCGCGGLGPDCADKNAVMGGPFTEGVGTGAGIALGLFGAAFLVTKIFGPSRE